MSFNLIKSVNQALTEQIDAATTMFTNLLEFAKIEGENPGVLIENVTNVLANIATTAAENKPIQLMNANSIAAFLSGVDILSQKLPNLQDATKKANSLRALAAVNVDPSGEVTYATVPIARLGAQDQNMYAKYQKIVNDYEQSTAIGKPNGKALQQAARVLQMKIDQAMRQAAAGQGGQQAGSEARGETTFSANKAAAQPGVM